MKCLKVSLIATALAWGNPASATDLIEDIPRTHPTLFRSYQRVLPQEFSGIKWLHDLKGITLLIDDQMMIGGKFFLHAHGCKPLDCGDNQVTFVFSTDGQTGAVKVMSREATGGRPLYYGSDDPALRRVLDRAI